MSDDRALDRSLAWAWYGGVLGGLLPVLLLGFLYSALADRTVFVLWAMVTGTLWVVLLHRGLSAGWGRYRLLGLLALLLAAGLAAFAALEAKHHEILDLGFRAVLPGVYHPLATEPRTMGIIAAVFGVVGIVGLIARSPHLPGPPLPEGEEGERKTVQSNNSPSPGEGGREGAGEGARG